MSHRLFLVIQELQSARQPEELTGALRLAVQRLYDGEYRGEGGLTETDGEGAIRISAPRLLSGSLSTAGDLSEAIVRLVYDREDVQTQEAVLAVADRCFVDCHPLYSIGWLATFLSRSHRGQLAEKHVWRLLHAIMTNGEGIRKLMDVDVWTLVFPQCSEEDVCETIVSWLIVIMESESERKIDELKVDRFLPRWVELLMEKWTSLDASTSEAAAVLFGVSLRRCLNRGLASTMIDALIDRCRSEVKKSEAGAKLFKLLRHIQDPHALQKFYERMLAALSRYPDDDVSIVSAFYPEKDDDMRDDVDYVLFHRLLIKQRLPKKTAQCIVHVLVESEEKLQEIVRSVAKTWSDKDAIDHMPLPDQAYRTYLLTLLIPHVPEETVAEDDRITRWLLEGVSNRLESALDVIRFQAMRVAHVLAAQQPNANPLFQDMDIDFRTLQPEEKWDHSETPPIASEEAMHIHRRPVDSDDDSDASSADNHDLEPLIEEDSVEAVIMNGRRPMTLIDLHNDLQNAEEPMKMIGALKRLPLLLKERPRELPSVCVALSRTLVHMALPDWISEELLKNDAGELKGLPSPTAVRVHCLLCLLVEAPLDCGGHVASMVASNQLAEYQRLEILEALRQAAVRLSQPPPLEMPRVKETTVGHDSEKTRRWGVRSLEKQKARPITWRNRFVDAVGLWTSSLLLACRSTTQRFDVMERNPVVVGGVMITLSAFADCTADSVASTSVVLSSFPLIKAVLQQHRSKVHLRRCGYRSLASLIEALPLGRLSAAVGHPLSSKTDAVDEELKDMLIWIKDQTENAIVDETDDHCRGMAGHVLHLCSRITRSAIEQLDRSILPFPSQRSVEYHIPSVPRSDALK